MYEIIVDRFKESGKWYATETIEVPKNLAEFEYPTYVKNLLNCPMLICLWFNKNPY